MAGWAEACWNSVDLLGGAGRGGLRSEDGHWHMALPQVNENMAGEGGGRESVHGTWGQSTVGEESGGGLGCLGGGVGMMEEAARGLVYLFEVDALP